MDSKSDLQTRLVRQLLKLIADGALPRETHLREIELSRQFGVSRSPVRAALAQLSTLGVAERGSNRGLHVTADPLTAQRLLATVPLEDEEQVKEQIARDWFDGLVPPEVSESFIRTRYGLGKVTLSRVLSMLSDEGIISRMPGYGWKFEPTLNSQAANDASYDFRLMIEPAAIRLPGFVFNQPQAAAIRAQHERLMKARSRNLSELFRLDEDFHLFIAECSRNLFIVQAITHQNKLRRLLEYQSLIDTGRLKASCLEHIEILDALASGRHDHAAKAMTRHLTKAKAATPMFRTAAQN